MRGVLVGFLIMLPFWAVLWLGTTQLRGAASRGELPVLNIGAGR